MTTVTESDAKKGKPKFKTSRLQSICARWARLWPARPASLALRDRASANGESQGEFLMKSVFAIRFHCATSGVLNT